MGTSVNLLADDLREEALASCDNALKNHVTHFISKSYSKSCLFLGILPGFQPFSWVGFPPLLPVCAATDITFQYEDRTNMS